MFSRDTSVKPRDWVKNNPIESVISKTLKKKFDLKVPHNLATTETNPISSFKCEWDHYLIPGSYNFICSYNVLVQFGLIALFKKVGMDWHLFSS